MRKRIGGSVKQRRRGNSRRFTIFAFSLGGDTERLDAHEIGTALPTHPLIPVQPNRDTCDCVNRFL